MNLSKLLKAFAEELERFYLFTVTLINEAIPGLSRDLLPEWEEDLGLPDLCSPLADTVDERAAIAHAKYYTKYDGQSKQFYIDYAASLGATVTVTNYSGAGAVFRVDVSRVDRTPLEGIDGARLRSKTSRFKWIINVYNTGTVSLEFLQCNFEKLKPAHTELIWNDLR